MRLKPKKTVRKKLLHKCLGLTVEIYGDKPKKILLCMYVCVCVCVEGGGLVPQ